MSAESRSLLPDWHQRPVIWKMESRTIEQAIQDRLDSRASWPTFGFPLDENGWPILPPLEKVETKPHRRSSCLTEYRTDTTANTSNGFLSPFVYQTGKHIIHLETPDGKQWKYEDGAWGLRHPNLTVAK